ncbi:glycosyltransferase family 4 protein [Flavobacterium lotistagni]|uniref:glycosyltransferase family 4 protein n=1 Tax=Flavobacterium lotistagni TaxID=2709660 RepID=UPI00293BE38D|nr:glycosyltransferase [Flavobacterium lotistagni]
MTTSRKKILFLGETYRADAITWMRGLETFGSFEIVTWELKTSGTGFLNRFKRIVEYCGAIFSIRKLVKLHRPDMVIAERTTSYGFLAALSGVQPVAIAQQGITDLWPEESLLYPIKKLIQSYAFRKATLIHAWGNAMTVSMKKARVDMRKVMVLPKGIDLELFKKNDEFNPNQLHAIVSRSLFAEYKHAIILKAFALLKKQGIGFTLTIVGDGPERRVLESLCQKLDLANEVHFTGRIVNSVLPELLRKANFYISMPVTEGVSASLFEAMASGCYPVVSDVFGNQSWITHRENGQLIKTNDEEMLAQELLWALENPQYRQQAIVKNRKMVEERANYAVNMKQIADRYHELIEQYQNR